MELSAAVIILVSLFVLLNSQLISSALCPAGCKCSDDDQAAVCCLPTTENAPEYTVGTTPDDLCRTDTIPPAYRWPQTGACLPSWRQLQIRLSSSSWPPILHSTGPTPLNATKCSYYLQRLTIYGTSAPNSGLTRLDASILRALLFGNSDSLNLTTFTVQQTQIVDILPGFFFTLRSSQLTDVHIRHNPSLTDKGLGVGWLGNTPLLRLLDLSRNSLMSVELARWGFSLARSSALTTLILSDNQIAHLRRSTFIRVPNLIKLDLSGNQLTHLPLDVFQDLKHLKILDLQNNHLTVQGLEISSLDLFSVLPDLRYLNVSGNPLLMTSTPSIWWLTGRCPSKLTEVELQGLSFSQSTLAVANMVFLPPIAWARCPSLTHITLPQSNILPCLPQHWVGLPPAAVTLPDHLRVKPASLKLCPPVTSSTAEPSSSTDGSSYGSHKHQKHSPYILDTNSGKLLANNQFISVPSDNNIHVIKLPTGSLALWIGILLLVLLCFILLGFGICFCVVRVCPNHNRNSSIHARYPGRCAYIKCPQPLPDTTTLCAPNAAYLVRAPSSHSRRTVYSPFLWSAANAGEASDSRSCPCSPHRLNQTNLHLLSAADSGLDDNTPMTMQYSFHSGRSPASSNRTSLLIDSHRFVNGGRHPESLYAHLPSWNVCRSHTPIQRTSFSSLRPVATNLPVSSCHLVSHPGQLQLISGTFPSSLVVPTSTQPGATNPCVENSVPVGYRQDYSAQATTDYASLGPASTSNCCDTPNNEFATTNSSESNASPSALPIK